MHPFGKYQLSHLGSSNVLNTGCRPTGGVTFSPRSVQDWAYHMVQKVDGFAMVCWEKKTSKSVALGINELKLRP